MDLLEFNEHSLYFDQPLPPQVEALLNEAVEGYADGALLSVCDMAPLAKAV